MMIAAIAVEVWRLFHLVEGTQYSTGEYYFFMTHSTVTRAGMKTKCCILHIRSERIREKEDVDITINDEWK